MQTTASSKRRTESPAAEDGIDSSDLDGDLKASAKRKPAKRPRTTKKKAKAKQESDVEWPEQFPSLFKLYKALNTVMAFVDGRRQMATTFSMIRKSVENITKEPLELMKIAQLKAILPAAIKFEYVPINELKIQESESTQEEERSANPSFSGPSTERQRALGLDEGHVLIVSFADTWTGKSERSTQSSMTMPSRSLPATKRMIEQRNQSFTAAVDNIIRACEASGEHSFKLLEASARKYIPINPDINDRRKGEPALETIPSSDERPSMDAVLSEIQSQDWYFEQIADHRTIPAKPALQAELDPPLSPSISQALKDSRKITTLYCHQVAAIDALSRGKDVIVSTSTASGKSVIYQVPLLRFLEEDPSSTAMFVYPTKALAQDQRGALEQLLAACPPLKHIQVATYDGDTAQAARQGIRKGASVIFTNFDMIHTSILPHEELWREFLKNLKLFVVDELHYYSGLFGSHVAYIMRRFRRVCTAVGNRRTRFVSCSATIAKPLEHMEAIFGLAAERIEVVTNDGAPSGSKECLLWNLPRKEGGNENPMVEAVTLMAFLMKRGIRVIMFCKIRQTCESAMKALTSELARQGRYDIVDRVRAYRGGYSAQDRRSIEQQAFTGHLLGIVATNALELGVDIGNLDAVITLGFPYSISSYRQQIGRAGRRSRDSLAVLVTDGAGIDSHFKEHPEELYKPALDEQLVLELDSVIILEAHLQCAAHEMPLSMQDEVYFGPKMKEVCDSKLVKDGDGWYQTHTKFLPYPAAHISIRGNQEEKYILVDTTRKESNRILEEIEVSRALFSVYEGGVYLHQGVPFIVTDVDHDNKLAKLVKADINWVTKPRDFTDVDAVQTHRIREIKNSPQVAYFGRVDVSLHIFGFFKMRGSHILDIVDLETLPYQRITTGMWIDVPRFVLDVLNRHQVKPAAAIHGAQHAFLNQFSLARDLKTECKATEKEYYKSGESQRKRPARLIFYDGASTGSGAVVSAKAFDHATELLRKAHDAVERCQCEDIFRGCLQCVSSPLCKEHNKVTSKMGALAILKAVLGTPFDEEEIPWPGYDEEDKSRHDTVVAATTVMATGGIAISVEPA